jgi:death-on-curing protein
MQGRLSLNWRWPFGVIRSDPFVDGNNRTGLLAVHVFLFLNDWHFDPDLSDEGKIYLVLGAGDVEEVDLAKWIAANAEKTVG